MNVILPLHQHKRQTLLRNQRDPPLQQLRIAACFEQVMNRRKGLVHASSQRSEYQHISALACRPALLLPQPP